MKKIRIRDLAKKLNIKNKCIIATLDDLGIKKHPNSNIPVDLAKQVIHLLKSEHYTNGKEPKKPGREKKTFEVTEETMQGYANLGLSKEDIADLHGMSGRSLRRRFEENPEFNRYYNMGRKELKRAWHQTVVRRALGRLSKDGETYIEKPSDRVLLYMGRAFFGIIERVIDSDGSPEKQAENIREALKVLSGEGFK